MNIQETLKNDYQEQSQKIKSLLDFLIMETLRLDRKEQDLHCIEYIAIMPEIIRAKEELLNAIGIEL